MSREMKEGLSLVRALYQENVPSGWSWCHPAWSVHHKLYLVSYVRHHPIAIFTTWLGHIRNICITYLINDYYHYYPVVPSISAIYCIVYSIRTIPSHHLLSLVIFIPWKYSHLPSLICSCLSPIYCLVLTENAPRILLGRLFLLQGLRSYNWLDGNSMFMVMREQRKLSLILPLL